MVIIPMMVMMVKGREMKGVGFEAEDKLSASIPAPPSELPIQSALRAPGGFSGNHVTACLYRPRTNTKNSESRRELFLCCRKYFLREPYYAATTTILSLSSSLPSYQITTVAHSIISCIRTG